MPFLHKLLILWCREGGSNPHGREGRRILSPLRLPVTILFSVGWMQFSVNCVRKCVNFDFFYKNQPRPPTGRLGSLCIGFWGRQRAGAMWWLEWDLNPHGIAPNGF